MVHRDVDMRLLIEEKIKGRLCFRKPTIAQYKRTSIPARPFIEPLTQLKEYQEHNSVEAIHSRAVATLTERGFITPEDECKKRRLLSFATTKMDIPESYIGTGSFVSKGHLPASIQALNRGLEPAYQDASKQDKLLPNLVQLTHPHALKFGKCEVSEMLDEVASYEGETDILKIIQALREKPEIKFFYLTHALPKSSTKYHYYNLKVAPFDKLNRNNYYTLSLHGCTHVVINDETEHISLERFETEYKTFMNICKIPTFARFRLWKGFTRWRKVIRYMKMDQCRRHLRDNLYIANSSLRPALLNVREMCYRISDMGLCKLEKGKTYTLLEFLTNQVNQLNEVCTRLCEFRELVKEVVRSACRTALLEAGFMPDDYFIEANANPMVMETQTLGTSYLSSGYDVELFSEATDKMTFTEMAAKRKYCQRLTCFIRLADYQIVSTLHTLTVNSVYTLLDCLCDHLRHTPPVEEIASYQIKVNPLTEAPNLTSSMKRPDSYRAGVEDTAGKPQPSFSVHSLTAESDVAQVTKPLFVLEFILEHDRLYMIPDEPLFRDGILEIISKFQEQVFGIKNLVPDPYFDAFTRPIINNKFEEKTCGSGPQLQHMFAEDTGLKTIIENVKMSLSRAFEAVRAYMNTFKEIHDFYHENNLITTEGIQQAQKQACDSMEHKDRLQTNMAFFRDNLLKHHREVVMTQLVPMQRSIGMFLIDTSTMRSLLLPSPNRCLELFHRLLPVDARAEVDRLVQETQEADYTLSLSPSTTVDFVKHLEFLVHMQTRIEPIEKEADVVKEIYDMIEAFNVPVPPEDYAVYQTLLPSIERAKNSIDRALSERDVIVDMFFASLDKDVAEMLHDMKEAKQNINNPVLLDATAERETVRYELQRMKDTIEDLQNRAALYREYLRSFKELVQTISGTSLEDQILSRASVRAASFVEFLQKWFPNVLRMEQPRIEELDLLVAEIKLKQLLWNSLEDWDEIYEQWLTADFLKLDTDELSATIQKYIKSVTMLEKGLPPNNVVPLLKAKVDGMKSKLPSIMDMRNPTLQPRHWQKLEELIGFHLAEMETPLSLGLLIELNAFSHAEAILEVSSQASSEASLEKLLKKVEDAWKSTEFTVLPYKDSKDIFIVGGTDEIQQLFDDSIINIATIASSRHVGPIKGRVEEWSALLDLFGKTLEEWLICQRSWLYLESIFSAPDIQRQLPSEAKSFMAVDKSYKDVMRKVQKVPLAMRAATQPGLLDTFRNNNQLLEQIQKCLEAYLESKRSVFPRFYFLSNDELLEILAQTRNPLAVQPHLRKCFDAISKLEFAQTPESKPDEPVYTNDILAMLSPEGERVALGKGLKARGNVEDWLGKVEEAMFANLKRLMKISINSFDSSDRDEWLKSHANQIILTVEQLMWCRDITHILEDPFPEDRLEGLEEFEKKCFADLNQLAGMVRSELPKLLRSLLCALITIDVHARDMVTELVASKVDSLTNFDWQRQLRYYWDQDQDICVVRMASACYSYGYEYLGASPRLVITPLTDRCYLCLMGALQLDLGGAPAGPAGTGKTETTKDLSKSVAKQCVVFNCSDGLDYKMMGRFFSGLAQSGAWCCFDEFNRIDIEVLSVIAQQLITIRNAKASKVSRFMFEGREIKLVPTCAAFITMNPGYAGRTELPDNLKSLFRPISMMVPDYRLIAEVILYSEGFESSKTLALKMTQMYKLCSEQLSQQDHYDFGMRALKSVLVMAGSLKRQNPDKPEDVVLIRALRDSNLPKFLKQDSVLFTAILQDLFPGVTLPEHDYGRFLAEIEAVLTKMGLQVVPAQVTKVIQFYETLLVRHGVMLVGPTGGGKTTVYRVLIKVLTNLHEAGLSSEVPEYQPVKTYVLNPKAITMGELYGEVNKLTLEWHDGLLASVVRKTCVDTSEDHQWVICDGPVDALWIENMNTVLDDNKMLCLANSERIKLTNYVHMLFEVQDLAVASPATVSRCGMVYVDSEELGWMPYVKTWLTGLLDKLTTPVVDYLMNLFVNYVDPCLEFVTTQCTDVIPQVPIARVQTMCKLLEVLLTNPNAPSMTQEKHKLNPILAMSFVFSLIWGLAGGTIDANWDQVDAFVRNLFDDVGDARLPQHGDLWSCYVDMDTRRMDSWEKMLVSFTYKKEIPFFDMIVPTVDTVRYGYLLDKLLEVDQSVLFTGLTGVGKSVVARGTLNNIAAARNYVPTFLNFSAQTSSNRTQEIIESKLEKRKKGVRGAPKDKRVILFVDDLNMPRLDTYGSQPPIELLRQLKDFGGFYDRDKLEWITILDVTLSAACGPPGGGRNSVTPRLIRHFSVFTIPPPSEVNLKQIFLTILKGFLREFPQGVRGAVDAIIGAAVEIYVRMAKELLPTPAKSHYVFNLRDLSKCVQGILQADPTVIRDKNAITRLFLHESLRVFHDRLISQEDKNFFYEMLVEMAGKYFGEDMEVESFSKTPILFGDFLKPGLPRSERLYEELTSTEKARNLLNEYLDEYNFSISKEMKLVFFVDAIEHVCRIARMIRQDRGNALLVGVGGTGKQSLTKLAAYINDYRCFQIELTRGYDYQAFHEDLKKLYFWAGVENKPTVFLFTDTQIVVEEFLEDINNILNSGEVPNLFENEEYERIIIGCRPAAKEIGIPEGNRDAIFDFCINRVRNNLHVVLCMSPVGSNFRVRCRMFPSLVNCCTIDWFVEWPEDALYGVALSSFEHVDLGSAEVKECVSRLSTEIHLSVSEAADRFYLELKRPYYTTPTSYLELLNLYLSMLATKTKELSELRNKFRNGLDKILETNELVVSMEVELTAMRPTLEVKQRDTEKLMHKLGEDQEQADIVRTRVKEDEAIAKQKAQETQAIADDAQRDLDEAVPALEAANKALDSLDKNDISEIRVFTKPPQLVQTVMEAVCLMLGQKPDWATAKSLLGDSNFLRRLVEYPKDEISDALLKKLKKYIDNPDFVPEVVEKTSKACKSMSNAELDVVVQKLRQKQAELAAVERKIAILQSEFDVSVAEKKKLEHRLALTTARLKRAAKLTTALADEQDRWSLSVDQFQAQIANIVGDVFVAAACVAYYGAFTADYRETLVSKWVTRCRELGIPVSEDPSLFNVLGDAFELRQWNTQGLPRDQVSTDNAILVTRTRRWPLMIDPQEQANRWIRTMEEENNLQVIKLTDMNLLRSLETCIRLGYPMLIEDVGETLDPALEPVLLRQTFMSSGRLLIRLGDSDVDYDNNFHLYLTTKMANPHYLPEVSIKVTLINFTVTPAGLEDQLLGDVTGIERPELEEQRSQLIVRINTDRNQLKATEDRILKLLFESEGNILDNEDLINTLNESKVKSGEINKRLTEATSTEQKITNARSKYSPVAARGSVMYFVITTMAEIDSMYQFSLKYFKHLFISTIQDSPESPILEERIQILLSATTLATYNSVARSLFERDKLVFSFMLCAQIMRQQGGITSQEWNYFLLGSGNLERARPPQPEETQGWLSAQQWRRLVDLAHYFPEQFSSLPKDLINGTILLDFDPPTADKMGRRPSITSGREDYYLLTPEGTERRATRYNSELGSFQKLLLISNFSKEEVVRAVTDFIRFNLGPEFIEAPECSLSLLFKEMDRQTPLVFILSPGSDPMGQLQRFSKEHGFADRIHSVSLGQGQGPAAEKLMEQAARNGDWVFLQNCHLAASWMIRLEELVKKRSDDPRPTNREFRLFLSSMPAKSFPISVLQNSVKVTNEPPKGLRANLSRALNELTAESFETHFLGETWRKLVFGICFFHAIVLERKKFGPLGWNISYDFNDSDRECALLNLDMFCQDRGVPWEALTYITSEITYGGRVTDFWDQRCLRTILERFFDPKTLEPTYTYSPSGIYYPPERPKLQDYKDYVLSLPLNASPELFGMHENANLVYQIQETNNLISTVLNIQPRTGAVGTGKTNDEIVHDLANTILERIPDGLDLKIAKPEFFLTDQKGRVDSLTTVMTQEVDRFNKLLHIVKDSLRQLQKAIKGFVVMSEGLEEVYTAFLHNQIPNMWSAAAYPSLKPLSSWVTDLALRCDFINCWMSRGRPRSFWISGFFFPQGFLTGTLQNYARKYDYPIDHLSFDFTVLPHYRDQEAVSKAMATLGFNQTLEADLALDDPEDGVLIHGLFMDGFRWNDKKMELADSILGETLAPMPVLHMKPEMDLKPDPRKYVAPLYKTSARAGVLSTTGMSTNFIVDIPLQTSSPPKYWIEMGTALICERDVED
ncbi:hypothetical protein CRM22_004505 [Opisthorchis felineus]|uniref:AAA+ ATPase domain-containing protein n=1 Tax=Opisthorchis felineus TaxID=147828 RepID=A0A4S2M2G6_OPIFE|nr:hypothetical protein CRM22_004505 [Opisthorchis felineus]